MFPLPSPLLRIASVRAHLVLLTLVTLGPVVVFSAILVAMLTHEERLAVERGLRETTRAQAVAVDEYVENSVSSLRLLAASEHLDDGDLPAFYRQAVRAVSSQPGWRFVSLMAANGAERFNTAHPNGPRPALRADEVIRRVLGTAAPAVSDLLDGPSPDRATLLVAVPVLRNGRVVGVLAAGLEPLALSRILEAQRIPSAWTGVILDRRNVIIARSRNAAEFIGRRATARLAARATSAAEGLFRDVTQEGHSSYGAFSRSSLTHWTVVLAVPATAVETAARPAFWTAVGGGALFLLLAVGLATLLGRRIANPIVALADAAAALGRGATPPRLTSRITEVDRVAVAIADAAAERDLIEAELRERTQAREEAERRATFLADASRVLAASLDYETTLQTVANLAVPRLADLAVITELADDGSAHRVAAAYIDPSQNTVVRDTLEQYPLDLASDHPVARVLRTGRPYVLTEIGETELATFAPEPEHRAMARSVGYGSYMGVPLVARGRTLGSMSFIAGPSGRRYGPADVVLAEGLARHAALAIDNAGLYEETQRRQREAETANRAKDEFLAVLSHELRTPLTAMLGWTRMLRSGRLSADQTQRALETIERNTLGQAQIINDLLDVSRIIAGKMQLDRYPVQLGPVVEEAFESVRRDAEAKGLVIERNVDPAVGLVLADPVRLQQVIVNLLTNAVKFTPASGRIAVTLGARQDRAEVQVRDTGDGIAPDVLPHIFDRFRQADSSATRGQGGLGLGLAIVRHLVDLHGGTVRAESPGRGQGSTFTVELPLLTARVERPWVHGGRRVEEHDDLPRMDGVRVLVVDDDESSREFIASVLAECGARVHAAESVDEALAVLEGEPIGVLVSDLAMPGASGYDLIRHLRTLEGAATPRDIPAIALSAYAGAEDRERALAAGFDLHVAKPVTPGRLAELVAKGAARTA